MVFSSETFLFLFLPLFLVAYYLTPDRLRSWTILIGSYIFYCWWRADFLLLFIAVTAWAYGCGLLIAKWEGEARAKTTMVIGIIGCLIVLGIFKYLNFFMDSFAALIGTTPENLGYHWQLILPIGVSTSSMPSATSSTSSARTRRQHAASSISPPSWPSSRT